MNDTSASAARWWWVRHAQVPDGGCIYGQRDLDCDCSDADAFGALASALPRDAVWMTSNLGRTHQTAAAIRVAMGLQGADKPIVVPEFAEQHLGDWQGMGRTTFFDSRGPDRHNFWFGPADERAPGGESFTDVVERTAAAVARLTEEYAGRDIVVVAHGGTIRAAIAFALKLEPEACLAFVIDNCSITRLEHLGGDARYHWRVAAVNHRPWIGGRTTDDR